MKVLLEVTLALEGEERYRFESARGGPVMRPYEAHEVVWRVSDAQAVVWAHLVYKDGRVTKNGFAFPVPVTALPGVLQDALLAAVTP